MLEWLELTDGSLLACASGELRVVLRRATSGDADRVVAMHEATFRRMLELRVGWSGALQRAEVCSQLTDAGSLCIELANDDDAAESRTIGHVLLTGDGAADVLLLSRIMVAPEWQRRGVGACVIRHVLRRAHALRCAVALTVWRENRAARRLYAALGFVVARRSGFKIAMLGRRPRAAPATTRTRAAASTDGRHPFTHSLAHSNARTTLAHGKWRREPCATSTISSRVSLLNAAALGQSAVALAEPRWLATSWRPLLPPLALALSS